MPIVGQSVDISVISTKYGETMNRPLDDIRPRNPGQNGALVKLRMSYGGTWVMTV